VVRSTRRGRRWSRTFGGQRRRAVDPDEVGEITADRDRDPYERFAEDTDMLMGTVFSEIGTSDRVRIDPAHGRPIQALLLDANVRYGYEGEEVMRFVYGMLDVPGR